MLLQAYFEQLGTAKSEPLGQLDLPHHEMAMPVTPHTERILLGASSSVQQSADAAAPSSMPMALMQFPLHSLPDFSGDYEGHGEVVLLPDGFSSSMESPHFQHQVSPGQTAQSALKPVCADPATFTEQLPQTTRPCIDLINFG